MRLNSLAGSTGGGGGGGGGSGTGGGELRRAVATAAMTARRSCGTALFAVAGRCGGVEEALERCGAAAADAGRAREATRGAWPTPEALASQGGGSGVPSGRMSWPASVERATDSVRVGGKAGGGERRSGGCIAAGLVEPCEVCGSKSGELDERGMPLSRRLFGAAAIGIAAGAPAGTACGGGDDVTTMGGTAESNPLTRPAIGRPAIGGRTGSSSGGKASAGRCSGASTDAAAEGGREPAADEPLMRLSSGCVAATISVSARNREETDGIPSAVRRSNPLAARASAPVAGVDSVGCKASSASSDSVTSALAKSVAASSTVRATSSSSFLRREEVAATASARCFGDGSSCLELDRSRSTRLVWAGTASAGRSIVDDGARGLSSIKMNTSDRRGVGVSGSSSSVNALLSKSARLRRASMRSRSVARTRRIQYVKAPKHANVAMRHVVMTIANWRFPRATREGRDSGGLGGASGKGLGGCGRLVGSSAGGGGGSVVLTAATVTPAACSAAVSIAPLSVPLSAAATAAAVISAGTRTTSTTLAPSTGGDAVALLSEGVSSRESSVFIVDGAVKSDAVCATAARSAERSATVRSIASVDASKRRRPAGDSTAARTCALATSALLARMLLTAASCAAVSALTLPASVTVVCSSKFCTVASTASADKPSVAASAVATVLTLNESSDRPLSISADVTEKAGGGGVCDGSTTGNGGTADSGSGPDPSGGSESCSAGKGGGGDGGGDDGPGGGGD